MGLKFPNVTDPPDVIADSVIFLVRPSQLSPANFLTQLDRFQHRTVAVPAAADVVNLARARGANELNERIDQIVAVDVVAHLFAAVTKDSIGPTRHSADHKV